MAEGLSLISVTNQKQSCWVFTPTVTLLVQMAYTVLFDLDCRAFQLYHKTCATYTPTPLSICTSQNRCTQSTLQAMNYF
jgi:hypothetical protein